MGKLGFDINDSLILSGIVSFLIAVIGAYYGTKYKELHDQKQNLLYNLQSFVKSENIKKTLKKIWVPEYIDLSDLKNLEDPNAIYKKSSSFLNKIHFENDTPINFKSEPILPKHYIHHEYKHIITKLHNLVKPIEKVDTEKNNLFKTNNKPLIIGLIAILFSVLFLVLKSITWPENKYGDLLIGLTEFLFPFKLPFIGFIVCLVILSLCGFIKCYLNN